MIPRECEKCIHCRVCAYNMPKRKPHCDFYEEERQQGEWIGNAFDEHYCNKCGHYALWSEEADGYYEVQSDFCPNCGANMRGDKE